MALKALLKSLEGLSDDIKKLYTEKDGAFNLEVEGMVTKDRLDTLRDENIEQRKQLEAITKKFDGIDVEKWKELQATEQKLRDKSLIDTGKIDELLASKLDPIKKEFQAQLDATKKENQTLSGRLEILMIDDQLTKLATTKGLRPTAIDDMIARGNKVFKLKDGKPTAIGSDGAQLLTKSGDPLTMQTWIDNLSTDAPHLFQSSTGSGAGGSGAGTNGAKTLKRMEWEKLDPAARQEFVTTGKGTVID